MENLLKSFAENEGGYFTAKSQTDSYYLFKIFKASFNVRGWAIDKKTNETLMSLETLPFKNFLKFCKFAGLQDFQPCTINDDKSVVPEIKLYIRDFFGKAHREAVIAFARRNGLQLPTDLIGKQKYLYVTNQILKRLESIRLSMQAYNFSSYSHFAIKQLRLEMNKAIKEHSIVIKELK